MSHKVYEIVRDRLVKSLEEGHVPWKKTWDTLGMIPRNLKTGKPYRGINILLLSGGDTPYWATYRQISEMGGQVRKGEHAQGIVVFWSGTKKEKTTDEATGEEIEVEVERDHPILRYYNVFNASQCDGLEVPSVAEPREIHPIEACEQVFKGNNPKMGIGEPAYREPVDTVLMPPREAFHSAEEYYASGFHEITHWTGHGSRLNRDGVKNPRFGSETYSREELTAEMGSAFLCGLTGIFPKVEKNSAAYIAGWLSHIKNGSALDVIRAAGDAQKGADFVMENMKKADAAAGVPSPAARVEGTV
jgi:antirestriction protein ArdC